MPRPHASKTLIGVFLLTAATVLGSDGKNEASDPLNRLHLVKLGSNFSVADSPVTYRYDPAPAYNSTDNDYMVVWRDGRSTMGDIYAQRVTAAGSPTGPNIAVWVKDKSQGDPVIAYNRTDNQYLVAWTTQEDGYSHGARGRRLAATGIPLLTTDFAIMTAGMEVAVVHNSQALGYLVTGRHWPGTEEIRAQRVTRYGNLVGTVTTVAPSDRYPGEAAYDPGNNRYLMVYRDLTSGSEGVVGRFILDDGTVWGTPFSIASEYPQTPQIAHDPINGRFLVVFRSVTDASLRGQLITFNGHLIGDIFTVHSSPNSDAIPDLAYSTAKQAYVVTWRNDPDRILAKVVTAEGMVSNEWLNVSGPTSTSGPKIAYNSREDEFLVVWADDRNVTAGSMEIFGQVISFPKRETFVADDR
jgi:hypothetical protein